LSGGGNPISSFDLCIVLPRIASFQEASLAQDVQHTQHDGHLDNVCLTGSAIFGAFCLGIAITGVIFWWALFASHGAG
jgi:hypothetical protein